MAGADNINVVLAKYAERAERYDEMADFMAKRVATGVPLDNEERDLFSAAFKTSLTGRRHAVRVSLGFLQAGGPLSDHADGYRSKVQAELMEICAKCTNLIQHLLQSLPLAGAEESKIFYMKMMGDYYRYMAEFAAEKGDYADQAQYYYNAGWVEAQTTLSTIHPTRLGLALNFSVFLHEVKGDTGGAIQTATSAYDAALSDAGAALQASDTSRESSVTLQLIQDNLALWCTGHEQ